MQFLEKAWKMWENIRNIKLVTNKTIEMKRTQLLLNKPVYLGLSILEMSKTVMYEFWNDHLKPKYGAKLKKQNYITWVKTAL